MAVWIDIINPSHALFFNSFLREFSDENYFITIRDRAETVSLIQSFGLKGITIGRDYRNGIKKSLSMVYRAIQLYRQVNHFNCAIGFENGMSVAVAKLRRRKSILFCD
ncbi:MAG: DUF354 domain-containing protein, partial [Thermotogota bacterium]|nr:DUF354 domain-containing protein [Thermotogota bacterium]